MQWFSTSNEKIGIYDQDFKIGFFSSDKKFINCNSIMSKCVSISIQNEDDFFYISDFINENEHD